MLYYVVITLLFLTNLPTALSADEIQVNGYMTCKERWQQMIDVNGRLSGKPPHRRDGGVVDSRNKHKVLYVHVGKTGGEFVVHYLNTSLHGLHAQSLHVHALDSQMLREFETIIISVRNPVNRLISAYYFWHPLVVGSKHYGESFNTFFKCCPTLTNFGNTLFANTTCGSIARSQALTLGKGHIDIDSCAYLGGVMKELRAKRKHVYLINTESLEADLKRVVELNHWTSKFYTPFNYSTLHLSHSFSQSPPSQSTPVARKPYMKENVSQTTLNQLSRYLDLTGELEMYATLQRIFGWK